MSINSSRTTAQTETLRRELVVDLQRSGSITAENLSRASADGERGDVALVGQIVLAFLSGGAAAALLKCLKAYIERDDSMTVRLKRTDGIELEVAGKHLTPEKVKETLNCINRFISKQEPY
jgi:hypothetical protein